MFGHVRGENVDDNKEKKEGREKPIVETGAVKYTVSGGLSRFESDGMLQRGARLTLCLLGVAADMNQCVCENYRCTGRNS